MGRRSTDRSPQQGTTDTLHSVEIDNSDEKDAQDDSSSAPKLKKRALNSHFQSMFCSWTLMTPFSVLILYEGKQYENDSHFRIELLVGYAA